MCVSAEESSSSSSDMWLNREQTMQTPVMMPSPHLTSTVMRDPKRMRPEDSYLGVYGLPPDQSQQPPTPQPQQPPPPPPQQQPPTPQQHPHPQTPQPQHHHQAPMDYKYDSLLYDPVHYMTGLFSHLGRNSGQGVSTIFLLGFRCVCHVALSSDMCFFFFLWW